MDPRSVEWKCHDPSQKSTRMTFAHRNIPSGGGHLIPPSVRNKADCPTRPSSHTPAVGPIQSEQSRPWTTASISWFVTLSSPNSRFTFTIALSRWVVTYATAGLPSRSSRIKSSHCQPLPSTSASPTGLRVHAPTCTRQRSFCCVLV